MLMKLSGKENFSKNVKKPRINNHARLRVFKGKSVFEM